MAKLQALNKQANNPNAPEQSPVTTGNLIGHDERGGENEIDDTAPDSPS